MSASTATGHIIHWLVWRGINSCTATCRLGEPSPAGTVTRSMPAWVPSRCISVPTRCPASVRCAARPSPGPGCSRATSAPIQVGGARLQSQRRIQLGGGAGLLVGRILLQLLTPIPTDKEQHRHVPSRSRGQKPKLQAWPGHILCKGNRDDTSSCLSGLLAATHSLANGHICVSTFLMPSPLGVSLCYKGRESPVSHRVRIPPDGCILTVIFAKAPFLSRVGGGLREQVSLNNSTENCRDPAEPVYAHLVASGPGQSVKVREHSHCGNSHRKGRLWTWRTGTS